MFNYKQRGSEVLPANSKARPQSGYSSKIASNLQPMLWSGRLLSSFIALQRCCRADRHCEWRATIRTKGSDMFEVNIPRVVTALVRRRADRRHAIQDLEECSRDVAAGLIEPIGHWGLPNCCLNQSQVTCPRFERGVRL